MSLSLNELQKAVYAALNGSSLLTSKIFDNVPEGQAFPYVQIGHDEPKDWSTATFRGYDVSLVVETFARGRGELETKQYMDEVHRLLDRAELAMSGQQMILCVYDTGRVDTEPDGVTFHGTQRFRTLIQEVP